MPGVLDFVSLKLFFEEVGTFETGSESWDFFFFKVSLQLGLSNAGQHEWAGAMIVGRTLQGKQAMELIFTRRRRQRGKGC